MEGWKYRSRQLLKAIFCHQNVNKKANRRCMKLFSASNKSVQRCLYPLFQNQRPHFLLLHLFQRMSQHSGHGQQNGKQANCWLERWSFRNNFKDTPSHISIESWGVYLSRIFLKFFLKPVYLTMVVGKFQILGLKIAGKYICESKNWWVKTLPQVPYYHNSRQKEITHFQRTVFENLFNPAERGRIWSWKKDQN